MGVSEGQFWLSSLETNLGRWFGHMQRRHSRYFWKIKLNMELPGRKKRQRVQRFVDVV